MWQGTEESGNIQFYNYYYIYAQTDACHEQFIIYFHT
jgi:hypothetical protein